MPYLMGGFPSLEESVAAGLAAADAGADLLELGIPFSDPLADGPVIHAAGTAALAAGATPHGVLGVCERLAERVPVVLMVYANIVLTAGAEALRARARRGRRLRPDRSRPAARRGRRAARGVRRRGPGAGAARGADHHAGADRRDRRGRARVRLHGVARGDHRRARRAAAEGLAETVERVRAATEVPVAVGFGISTAEQARAVAEIADGVIVGSRVVRAAGEGGAEAVGAVVAELAEAM